MTAATGSTPPDLATAGLATAGLATADLVDAFAAELQSCTLPLRDYGGRRRFHGPARTLRCFEDNAAIKTLLSSPGVGSVLVVDGGGSLRAALVGDVIAGLAQANGWAGLVIFGAVRDTLALARLDLGVKALASNPWKSGKTGAADLDAPVSLGGVTVRPGDWVYADEDGVVVAPRRLPA